MSITCRIIILLLITLFNFKYTAGNNESKALFYIHELDEEFWWRWPVNGSDCTSNGYVDHEHKALSGMGPPIDLEQGLFLTWHFSMFSSLYNRYKRSRRRTLDPTKASVFIIPYDLGLDGYLNNQNCKNRRQCSGGLVTRLVNYLKNNTYWNRHKGADHLVMWSLGQYHPWPSAGCNVFMKTVCAKCTFTCYWMDSFKPESRFISAPFPSAYHWLDGMKDIPWAVTTQNIARRNLTVVYLGSTQTLNPTHTKIRRAMAAQCNASTSCHWKRIAHSSIDTNIGDLLSVYRQATFCLCPPGDDPARKAVFDAILSGCIPVIFDKATIYNQYPWHIGEQTALDISVNIPGALVRSGRFKFMSTLLSIPADVIRLKQLALEKVAPRVQYAMPPLHTLENIYDTTSWDPPFPDAAEITLDGFIARVGHLFRNESTQIPPAHMLLKSWHDPYNSVIVKIPGLNASFLNGLVVNVSNSGLYDISSRSSKISIHHDIKKKSHHRINKLKKHHD